MGSGVLALAFLVSLTLLPPDPAEAQIRTT